jgi:hypothetical protein
MDFIERFFLYMTFISLLCLLVGLLRPWMMLWWEDTQNRKKIIKVYGTAGAISYALYWLTVIM